MKAGMAVRQWCGEFTYSAITGPIVKLSGAICCVAFVSDRQEMWVKQDSTTGARQVDNNTLLAFFKGRQAETTHRIRWMTLGLWSRRLFSLDFITHSITAGYAGMVWKGGAPMSAWINTRVRPITGDPPTADSLISYHGWKGEGARKTDVKLGNPVAQKSLDSFFAQRRS